MWRSRYHLSVLVKAFRRTKRDMARRMKPVVELGRGPCQGWDTKDAITAPAERIQRVSASLSAVVRSCWAKTRQRDTKWRGFPSRNRHVSRRDVFLLQERITSVHWDLWEGAGVAVRLLLLVVRDMLPICVCLLIAKIKRDSCISLGITEILPVTQEAFDPSFGIALQSQQSGRHIQRQVVYVAG